MNELVREQFIEDNQKEWIKQGQKFKKEREELDVTLTTTAEAIGISRTTLRHFEDGKPVRASKIIKNAFEMYLMIQLILKILREGNN